jgi:hypothetical protein
LDNEYEIKDSGIRRNFGTGAVRDITGGKGRFDLIPPATLRALAIHYQKGCEKYGDRNWEHGIPVGSSFLDSGIRHLEQVVDGRTDENHFIAGIWNAICGYQTILWIQEGLLPLKLYDLPRKVVLPDPYGQYSFNNWAEVVKKNSNLSINV